MLSQVSVLLLGGWIMGSDQNPDLGREIECDVRSFANLGSLAGTDPIR